MTVSVLCLFLAVQSVVLFIIVYELGIFWSYSLAFLTLFKDPILPGYDLPILLS